MKSPNGRHGLLTVLFPCLAVILLLFRLSDSYAEALAPPPEELLRLGERMYREGILPSGKMMQASGKGDPVPGTSTFACVSCHQRSGLGSYEGGVYTPPANGAKLFQPVELLYKGVAQNPKYSRFVHRRPAYTNETLADALRRGVDPTGRVLSDVMPRYQFDETEMAVMISYLRSLSSRYSPGVTDTTLTFATVVTDDIPPGERDALFAPLEQYVKSKNGMAAYFASAGGGKSRFMAEKMFDSRELSTRRLALSRWLLTGPPETWRCQLEEYYRKEPVFALLGGATQGEWQPIHRFCEENRIPALFPDTDFPVVSESDWYTLYVSKGYYQEGEGAARYLNALKESLKEKAPVQVVRDSPAGRALARGFRETWQELGNRPPVTVVVEPGRTITGELLRQVAARESTSVVLVWDGPGALPALESFAAPGNRPEMVFVSARYLAKSIGALPDAARDFTYITYPFVFAQKEVRQGMGVVTVPDDGKLRVSLATMPNRGDARTRAALVTQVLTMALMDLKGNYYRDNLLDVIGMIPDQYLPSYVRLSFGPGQRYASKGCYIVQLAKGPNPDLIRRSDWVIH